LLSAAEVEFEIGHLAAVCRLLQQVLAAVALAPLDQHETKRQLAVTVVEGEVLVDELLLQGHGGGGDHQLLLGEPCHRDGPLGIGERLADAGAGFGHQDATLFVIFPGQCLGYLGHQKILLLARHKTG